MAKVLGESISNLFSYKINIFKKLKRLIQNFFKINQWRISKKHELKKIKVFIDVYYYKAALSGIRTYISELTLAAEIHGSKNIEYIFSHEIDELSNNQLFLNSKNQLIRWLFQLNYLIWKQLILPVKLLWHKPDYLICPDYISPILSFKTKKLTVIHDSLFWDYPKNYSSHLEKIFPHTN